MQPETQFKTVLYTGDGADRNIDVGFEADFVWIKKRDSSSHHRLYDRVRGNGQTLLSSVTSAEYDGVNDGINFDYANGFNIDVGVNAEYYNNSGSPYVAWCWKAGGTAVSNTDGSITSQVSANVDAGFSIVSYTGSGSAGATVGHGLTQAPEMVIYKRRDSVANWIIKSSVFGVDEYLIFTTDQKDSDSGVFWNSTLPTSTVYSLGNSLSVNGSSATYIAYCFHSVEGFSKFGSYVGNGSTNGPFVYTGTGFKPAFVMIKRTDNVGNWWLFDAARNTYNVIDDYLYADTSSAEASWDTLDFLSNGFKLRVATYQPNTLGGTFIYMAFAENPFKYATGR